MTETGMVLSEYLAVGIQSEFHPREVTVLTMMTISGLFVRFEFKHEFGWTIAGAMHTSAAKGWQMVRDDLIMVAEDFVQRMRDEHN